MVSKALAAAMVLAGIAGSGLSAIANPDDQDQSRYAVGGECSKADATAAFQEYKAAEAGRIVKAYSGVVESGAESGATLVRKVDSAYRGCRRGEAITMPRFQVQRHCDLKQAVVPQAGDEVSCVQK
jgi:hypothetical protein